MYKADNVSQQNLEQFQKDYQQICNHLSMVMNTLLEWNSGYTLDDQHVILDAKFTAPVEAFLVGHGSYPDRINEVAKDLHDVFWSFTSVASLGFDFGDEWDFFFNDYQFEKLFTIGALYERLEILLVSHYGHSGYLDRTTKLRQRRHSVLEVTQDDIDKLGSYEDKHKSFQESGTQGKKRKSDDKLAAIRKYIDQEYGGDISEIKVGVLANNIYSEASKIAALMKSDPRNESQIDEHPFGYLAVIIHPLFDRRGVESASRYRGQVLSNDRILKKIRKIKKS